MLEVLVLALLFGVACVAMMLVAVHLVAASRNTVPPVFTPPRVLGEVVRALDLPETGRFVDLGCGDGRVLVAVLARRPKLQVVGIENNPVVLGAAKMRLRGRAELVMGQIERVDLHDVKRVFAYLGPELMAALEMRFGQELPKGARVVSQQFPLPSREPTKVVELAHGKSHAAKLYIYDY